jgi:hypothetical protein
MRDEILEEIWRVRDELVKKHGGLQGYFDYLQKLERSPRLRGKIGTPNGRARTAKRPAKKVVAKKTASTNAAPRRGQKD